MVAPGFPSRSAPTDICISVGPITMADDRYTSDEVTDDIDDDSGSSIFSYTGTLPLGLPSRSGSETSPDEYGDHPSDDEPYGDQSFDDEPYGDRPSDERTTDDSWVETGFITVLFVVGVVLFLIPEPATSGIGVVLIAAGVVLWLLDWLG